MSARIKRKSNGIETDENKTDKGRATAIDIDIPSTDKRIGKSDLRAVKLVLWGVILGFLGLSIFCVPSTFYAAETAWCGNSVTFQLLILLNLGVPLSLSAVVGLLLIACRGEGKFRDALFGGILLVGTTFGLVAFGLWIKDEWLGGECYLVYNVWWMFRL